MKDILTRQLHLGDGFWYNALPIGKFHDPRYGVIQVTPKLIESLAGNFGKVPAYKPPVKFGHGDGASSPGIIAEVEARKDGLWIRTDFQDDDAVKELKKGNFRYMSAEYVPDYMDKGTGKGLGPALLGIALTNQPAHPGVKPIVFSEAEGWTQNNKEFEEEEKKKMDMEAKLAEAMAQLTAEKAKVAEFTTKLSEVGKEVEGLKTQLTTSQATIEEMNQAKHEAEVQAFCDKQIAAGIPPAIVDKVKPVLMAAQSTIKLSDKEETNLQVLFGEVFDGMAKVQLGANGKLGAEGDKEILMADDIANCANQMSTKNKEAK